MSRIRVNSIKPISGQIVSLSGSLIVTGDVTAEQFITEKVQTSIIYRSGSTLFGDSADDLHNFTGSVFVSGGLDSNKSITLGDDINLQKGVNGGGLLEVLPTDTEGLHGLQLAAETTSSNVNYTTFYNNKFSISEAGRDGVAGGNGEHIKLEDYYKVESGIPTRYAGIQINHPSSSRFKLGANLKEEADYPFYVNADSKFKGDLSITGSTFLLGDIDHNGDTGQKGDYTRIGTLDQEGTVTVSNGDIILATAGRKIAIDSKLDIFSDVAGNSHIQEKGSGDLLIVSDNEVEIKSGQLGETFAKFTKDGPIELYYDNAKKFSTTTNGIAVTGTIYASDDINTTGKISADNDIVTIRNIKAESGQLSIAGYSNVSESIARLDHFSSSLDNYYATDAQLDSVSSSLALETAHLLNFSSSFDNIYASEDELYTATASLDARIISLESFSSSIDSEYATDAQLDAVSASFAIVTTANVDDIAILQTDVSNNNDDIAALSGSQLGLLAATSSYALKADITGSFTMLSASIAQSWTENHNDIHDLEQDAYTFVPSASIELNYVSKAKLRAALTGSTNYNDFTGSLLALLA